MSWQQTPRRARITDIITLASRMSGISTLMLTGTNRNRDVVRIRHAICQVARENGHSFPKIGKMLGGRDHSTVIYALEQVSIHAERKPDYAQFIADLRTAAEETAPFIEVVPEELIPEDRPLPRSIGTKAPPPITQADKDELDGLAFLNSIDDGNARFLAALRGAA